MNTNGGKDEFVMQCKEPGCTESVRYEPVIVFGYISPSASAQKPKKKKRVYLLCPKGHEHSYDVIE
jgi:hypothetical protein